MSAEHAKRAGWRLDEVCHCREPRIAWGGGDGYVLPSVCWKCRRRAPHIVVGAFACEVDESAGMARRHSVRADRYEGT